MRRHGAVRRPIGLPNHVPIGRAGDKHAGTTWVGMSARLAKKDNFGHLFK
jgi:hypothetical protein